MNVLTQVDCPLCEKIFTLPYIGDSLIGKTVTCGECKEKLSIILAEEGTIVQAIPFGVPEFIVKKKGPAPIEWRKTKAPHLIICDGGKESIHGDSNS